jgi:ATP-dependent helicase/nuclease subunit A
MRRRRKGVADLFVVGTEERQARRDGLPPDHVERERALDIGRSWIVEAPAGSGKTGLLIQRYLKLLGDESVDQPEQVLAITFTVKAATEIRERVMEQLESAARSDAAGLKSEFDRETRALAEAVLQRDGLLGWQLLEHPRRLNVRTIDSVCAEIARSLPVSSGGGGGQAPVLDASMLYREAARRTLMQLGSENTALNDALRTVLLHRDGNLAECELLIAGMLQWRDQWAELVPVGQELSDDFLDGTVLPRLQRALEDAVCAGLTRVAGILPEDVLRRMALLAGEFAELPPYKPEIHPFAICRGMQEAPAQTAEHLQHWRALISMLVKKDWKWRGRFQKNDLGVEVEKRHGAAVKALVDELREDDVAQHAVQALGSLPPAVYPKEQWRVAKALFRVLRRALAELQVVFAERGECDFGELGILARSALRQEGGVGDLAAALGIRLQHLLVDEMQDTSTSQYELIQLLTDGWDGHGQTVFLVGDPKQSIYLFRQARVERFVRTAKAQRLGELPLGRLQLTANFRSQSELVDAFNENFSRLFPHEAARPEEVPYVAADAVQGPSRYGGQGAVWHAQALPRLATPIESKIAKRARAKADAEEVRAIVQRWRKRPLPERREKPWRIAVLVRSRAHLMDVVAALKRDEGDGSIPFRAVNIEPLGERQEVLDLFALTRALLHPADRVAWLAVLHAPWCGLGLAELHRLTGADDPAWEKRCIEDAIEERGDLLSEESCARLGRVWTVMRAAAAQRGRMSIAQWVERTWRSLGGDAYLGAIETANARRYLQLLDELEEAGRRIDVTLLRHRLKNLFAESEEDEGAVDLMTIHGAKGLEWDVVIVPGLEKRARSDGRRLLLWDELDSDDDAAANVVLAPIAGKGEGSKELNTWLRSIHEAREAAERKRLFYVACTRAREELHLFAAPETKMDGTVSRAAGSLLSAAWPAAERHFASASMERTADVFVLCSVTKLVTDTVTNTEDEFIGDIAAVSEPSVLLERLPLGFEPEARFTGMVRLSYGNVESAAAMTHFARPEGSFEARSFGNAVHAFLEVAALRLSEGVTADALLREVMGWGVRIASVLRGDGLPPAMVERLTARVQTALGNALRDPEGLWLLGAREQAASEHALTSWSDSRRSIRLDRIFRAGAAPLSGGTEFLWIVDYKTTAHGREGMAAFLEGERKKYGPQMEAYARIAAVGKDKVRMALYYPMLPALIWWELELG